MGFPAFLFMRLCCFGLLLIPKRNTARVGQTGHRMGRVHASQLCKTDSGLIDTPHASHGFAKVRPVI